MITGPSMNREELEPCYSCHYGVRIPHDIGGEFVGESVACHCPLKVNGKCTCQDVKDDLTNETGIFKITLTVTGPSTADQAQDTANLMASILSVAIHDFKVTVEKVA